MSLPNAIHRYWGNRTELTEQVPVSRFYTGKIPEENIDRPYLVLEYSKESDRDSSNVVIENYTVTFTTVCANAIHAETICQLIEQQFDDQICLESLTMDGNDELMASYWLNTEVSEPQTALWQGVVTYRFQVGTLLESPTT